MRMPHRGDAHHSFHASEMRYLDAYEKAPLHTDWRYFRKALYNILIYGAKSS